MFLDFTDNFQLNNIFIHGQWLTLARESFKQGKKNGTLVYHSNKFVDWVEERCGVKKSRAYDYMKFTENFSDFPRVLQCSLPFYWFKRYGQRVSDYLCENDEEGNFWR